MTRNKSYVHCPGVTPLLGETVDEMFARIRDLHPQREALVSIPQDDRLTYTELDARVNRVAKSLVAMGIGRGDRVGVWSTDNTQWVLLQLATARVGAVLVNLNPAYRVAELRHALRLAQVNAVFLIPSFRSSAYVEMLLELVPEARRPLNQGRGSKIDAHLFPHLRSIVVWDPSDLEREERWAPGMLTWREFLEQGSGVPDASITERAASLDCDDPINIQFTSGTTGFPKAVVLTHHNIVNNAHTTASGMALTEQDRLCVPLPFYHCFGMVVSNLVSLSRGACVVIPADHFEAGATLHAIETERCTVIHGVPTMFAAELDHPEFKDCDLSSLRTGIMAGAPCPPELMRRVMEDMGCTEILIGFGQTEASPIVTLTKATDPVQRRLETVGTPVEHQQVKIIHPETGQTLPVGVQGEVCFRGYNTMRGYYGQPEETANAIDDAGWLHSGDLGTLDEDGYLAITGRLKDMIIRGGENIYPAEIEAFYFEHPGIEQIAVFGVPDERLGETVGAWVKLREGVDENHESLKAFAKGNIAHFKVPSSFWFVESFPMTVTGKIQKVRMVEAVLRWLEAGGEDAPSCVESYLAEGSPSAQRVEVARSR